MRAHALAVLTCTLVQAGMAPAAPFVPADDREVVEHLPSRLLTPSERVVQRTLRAQRAATPENLSVALAAARAALQRARQTGDPREHGEAQAALSPWWSLPDPPAAVRLLRAMVWQSQHQFEPALRDLERLVAAPATPVEIRAQAALTRLAVLQVTGQWAAATAVCAELASPLYHPLGDAVAIPAGVCDAELASLRGETGRAKASLADLSRRTADPANRRWVALVRAELAERTGDPLALALYREALGPAPDVYTLAALADWLLAHDRAADAAALLANREEADALLLRLAIAWRRTADPRAAAAARRLAERHEAAARRDDNTHRREQARSELDVKGNAPAALSHAVANWTVQKEPADALLLVRAATAAGEPAAAAPVWAFARATGLVDVRLAAASDRP